MLTVHFLLNRLKLAIAATGRILVLVSLVKVRQPPIRAPPVPRWYFATYLLYLPYLACVGLWLLKQGLLPATLGLLLKQMLIGATWNALFMFTRLVIVPSLMLVGATAGPRIILSTCRVRLQHGVSLVL